jgi:GNAT superfamily N-acetyltransferase
LFHSAQPSTPISVVAFSTMSYPQFTSLWNEAYPELKRTEFEMRLLDMSPARRSSSQRWLAEQNGEVIGFGECEADESNSRDKPKYQLHLFVSAEHRGQGIGERLYQQVTAALVNKSLVRAWVRRDQEEVTRFLAKRGFVERMRTFHSELDVAAFNLSRLEKFRRRLERYRYQFRAFNDLTEDPERNRKTYDLYGEVLLDIPSAEPHQIPSFAEYEKKILRSPELFSALFIALHHREYVGLCILLPHGRTARELYADTLGVKQSYRGRGIAQALSHSGIEYAKNHGYSLISADTFVENRKIGALLESLGFSEGKEWSLFSKTM